MPGGVVSRTVTEKVHWAWFSSLSCAVQVTTVVPNENVEPDAGAQVIDGSPSQRSVALAANVTIAPPTPVHSST